MSGNPTILRMRLGSELRALRNGTGLSLEAASAALIDADYDISTSKLSRLETGKGAVRLQDIRALLDFYRVTDDEQRAALLQMAREAKSAVSAGAWWTDYESVLPTGLSTYVALEAGAGRLMAFTGMIIDGLLQTEEYARAMIRAGLPTEPAETVERLVELRLHRQQAIHSAPRLDLMTIMDEGAMLRQVGGEEVMRRQLLHILTLCAETPNVSVQVIPLSKGAHIGQRGMFTVVEPRDLTVGPVAYVDSTGGNLYLQRPDMVSRYRTMFSRLQALALDPVESLALIRRTATEESRP